MNPELIAQGNDFFYRCVAISMAGGFRFDLLVLESLDHQVRFYIEYDEHHRGYILLDATDIKKKGLHERFRTEAQEVLQLAAAGIPLEIPGEMKTDISVVLSGYNFDFKIIGYERDTGQGVELVSDPSLLSEDEPFGRVVELKISVDLLSLTDRRCTTQQ